MRSRYLSGCFDELDAVPYVVGLQGELYYYRSKSPNGDQDP